MFFSWFFMIFIFLKMFGKKLIPLLSLEGMMILVILLFLLGCLSYSGHTIFVSSLIFLVFMVLDSVFGISILIFSCRGSSPLSMSLF